MYFFQFNLLPCFLSFELLLFPFLLLWSLVHHAPTMASVSKAVCNVGRSKPYNRWPIFIYSSISLWVAFKSCPSLNASWTNFSQHVNGFSENVGIVSPSALNTLSITFPFLQYQNLGIYLTFGLTQVMADFSSCYMVCPYWFKTCLVVIVTSSISSSMWLENSWFHPWAPASLLHWCYT